MFVVLSVLFVSAFIFISRFQIYTTQHGEISRVILLDKISGDSYFLITLKDDIHWEHIEKIKSKNIDDAEDYMVTITKVQYNTIACSKDYPILVQYHNIGDRPLLELRTNLRAHYPGRSSNLVVFSLDNTAIRIDDTIISAG
jgi:hypothetical protein